MRKNEETPKTLKDLLLEGGIRERIFLDNWTCNGSPCVYTIEEIEFVRGKPDYTSQGIYMGEDANYRETRVHFERSFSDKDGKEGIFRDYQKLDDFDLDDIYLGDVRSEGK